MSSMPYLTAGTMPKKEWPVIKEKKHGFLSNFKEAIEGISTECYPYMLTFYSDLNIKVVNTLCKHVKTIL